MNFAIVPKLESVSPTSARFGSIITLTGLSFGETRESNFVSFNNISATEYQAGQVHPLQLKYRRKQNQVKFL